MFSTCSQEKRVMLFSFLLRPIFPLAVSEHFFLMSFMLHANIKSTSKCKSILSIGITLVKLYISRKNSNQRFVQQHKVIPNPTRTHTPQKSVLLNKQCIATQLRLPVHCVESILSQNKMDILMLQILQELIIFLRNCSCQ